MLFFNEDWIHFFWTRYDNNMPYDEAALKEFIYQYKGTQITDFALNVNGSISSAKTKFLETFADKYSVKRENGFDVDYKNTYAKVAYDIIEDMKIDQYQIWVDTLREIGINPWISVRMNDCHNKLDDYHIRKSSWEEKEPERWRVKHRRPTEYFDKCHDYTMPEVRERMLSYIKEMIERYEPYGIELDFTREMTIFPIGAEYDSFSVITAFIEEVRRLAKGSTKVSVLIGADISATFNQGYDIEDWCSKGLVDYVTILPRWETINTAMDIGLWKKLIKNGVKLGTGLQLLARPEKSLPDQMAMIDHDFGQSVANLSMGADFIYLYNHFDTMEGDLCEISIDNSIRETESLKLILENIAELDTAMKFKRRHLLTYNDYIAPWEKENPRLPMKIDSSFGMLRIAVGKINSESETELVLGFREKIDAEKLEVYINSTPATFIREGGRYDNVGFSATFKVQRDVIKSYAVAEISYDGEAELNFAEIIVYP